MVSDPNISLAVVKISYPNEYEFSMLHEKVEALQSLCGGNNHIHREYSTIFLRLYYSQQTIWSLQPYAMLSWSVTKNCDCTGYIVSINLE